MDSLLLKSFLPEIFLSLVILLQLLFNINIVSNYKNNYPLFEKELFFQLYYVLFFLILLFFKVKIEGIFSNFFLLNDLAAIKIKIIFTCFSLLVTILIWQSYLIQNLNFFEFFILFFFVVLASLLLISCYDLLSAYLVLELQALCFYILAGFKRNSTLSSESALKYFISGSFFSCIFLFGISLIYGEFGTTNLYFLNILISIPFDQFLNSINFVHLIANICIISTIFFKLAIVPFHFWAPDVYDGAPLSSTIIFSILPKIILFTFLIRFLLVTFKNVNIIESIFCLLGGISIFWGTLYSLKQKRLKKLFIYSSIAQIGFLIIALATFSEFSLTSIYFFLIIYNLTSILSWGFLTSIYIFKKQSFFFNTYKKHPIFLSELSNLFLSNKFWGFASLIIFFSMAGMPPFAGFLSKFYIFLSVINSHNFSFIILIMIIISASAFYYLRVLKIIFFEIKSKSQLYFLFQGNFNFIYKDFLILSFCFCLFGLIFLFYYPTFILLVTKYTIFGFFNF